MPDDSIYVRGEVSRCSSTNHRGREGVILRVRQWWRRRFLSAPWRSSTRGAVQAWRSRGAGFGFYTQRDRVQVTVIEEFLAANSEDSGGEVRAEKKAQDC